MSHPTISLKRNFQRYVGRSLKHRVKLAEARHGLGRSDDPLESSAEAGPSQATPSGSRPYNVLRTPTGGLPVYSESKADGTWKTIIRKVEGDVPTLRNQINDHFREIHLDPLRPAPQATIRSTNQHLVIKGKHVEEVKEWMSAQGL